MKSPRIRYSLLGALPLLVLLGGCIAVANRQPVPAQPTLGQQLIDLQKARDSGALAEPEYEAQRAKLLSSSRAPAHE